MRNETTAFVIVSGYDDFSYCREALKLQITDYLLKPVDYEEFGACIDHLRIALFEKGAARADAIGEGEKTIWSLTRYLQEHLSEEILSLIHICPARCSLTPTPTWWASSSRAIFWPIF